MVILKLLYFSPRDLLIKSTSINTMVWVYLLLGSFSTLTFSETHFNFLYIVIHFVVNYAQVATSTSEKLHYLISKLIIR